MLLFFRPLTVFLFGDGIVWISPLMVDELKRIVQESEILQEDDAKWPKRNATGRQELEVRLGKEHISFEVSRGSILFLKGSG